MTKRELANRILTLLGVNTRTSSAGSQEINDTLMHLEDWMLANNAVGRRIGWVTGTSDPDEDAGIPDWSVMGVVNSMAIYMAPYFDKMVHPSIVANAALGMQAIMNETIEVQEMQFPAGFPRGQAASQPWGPQYFYPENRVVTGGDYLTDEGDDPVVTP